MKTYLLRKKAMLQAVEEMRNCFGEKVIYFLSHFYYYVLMYSSYDFSILLRVVSKRRNMATIVNNPGTTSDSSGGNGLFIGVVLLFVVILLFWFFGMSYFRSGSASPTNIENNVQTPEIPTQAPAQGGDTNITIPVPDKVDVNLQNGQRGQ
jgi:hypothetical protein